MNSNHALQKNRGCLSALGWILLAAGVFFLGALLWNQVRLVVLGQVIDGAVTEVTTRVTYGGGGSRKPGESMDSYGQRSRASITHELHVHCAPEGAEPFDFVTTSTFGHELKAGDSVRVIHVPGSPKSAEIYSDKQLWLPMVVGAFVSFSCLGAGIFLRRLVGGLPPA